MGEPLSNFEFGIAAAEQSPTPLSLTMPDESPSQFSREYSRMFGSLPIKDIERLQTA